MANKIYYNGNIYTVDAEFTTAQAMVENNGRLIYVGDNETALRFQQEDSSLIDLKGKTVLPGLFDAHLHTGWYGHSLVEISGLLKSKEQILQEVAERAACVPEGTWIIGRSWNNVLWEDTSYPTKEDLDAVAPNHPVYLHRICAHCAWVNSLALKLAGIDRNTPNCEGGEILRDENGEATGIITDHCREIVEAVIPEYTDQQEEEAMLAFADKVVSCGITSCMDAGASMREIHVMEKLISEKRFPVRMYVCALEGETARYYLKHGPIMNGYDNHMTLRCIKYFSDGSLSSRGAYLLTQDYADRPGHRGTPCYTDQQLYELVKEARLAGFQVACHANADGSSNMVVNAYARVLDELPLKDNRYRIEHFQISTDEMVEKAARYNMVVSMQTQQCGTDRLMAEARLGKDSDCHGRSYAWRDCIDAGMVVANGSDSPCDINMTDPFYGFYVAVTRCDRSGEPEGGWHAEQCMNREEALRSLTCWAAYAQFEENIKGSLEAGKLADFIIIDRDVMKCEVRDIITTRVLQTVIGGQTVYTAIAD